jgi:LmbE family N-acetylglucosaminyl deacetylase
MAGVPSEKRLSEFAKSLHSRWQTPTDAILVRRAEDILACNHLGADYLHWDLLDCIYRIDSQSEDSMYDSEESLFGSIHQGDKTTLSKLVQLIHKLPAWQNLVIPLSVGNHVDHQLCRKAAEQLFCPSSLLYYEEYPYIESSDVLTTLVPAKLRWVSKIISLTPEEIHSKIDAIASYKSQLSTFFDDYEDMVDKITDNIHSAGGERLWHPTQRKDNHKNSTLG